MDSFTSLFTAFADALVHALPVSPFKEFISNIGELPYLSWLNWVCPVGTFIQIGMAWLVAIGVFYLYMVVARWVKVIGD